MNPVLVFALVMVLPLLAGAIVGRDKFGFAAFLAGGEDEQAGFCSQGNVIEIIECRSGSRHFSPPCARRGQPVFGADWTSSCALARLNVTRWTLPARGCASVV